MMDILALGVTSEPIRNRTFRFVRCVVVVAMHVSLIYLLLPIVNRKMSNFSDMKSTVCEKTHQVIILVLWQYFWWNGKDFLHLVDSVRGISVNAYVKTKPTWMRLFPVAGVLYVAIHPSLMILPHFFMVEDDVFYRKFFRNSTVPSVAPKLWKFVFYVPVLSSMTVVCDAVSLFYMTVCLDMVHLLRCFAKRVDEVPPSQLNVKTASDLYRQYLEVRRVLSMAEKTMNVPAFLIIAECFAMMFNGLAYSLGFSEERNGIRLVIWIASFLAFSVMCFVLISTIATMVHESDGDVVESFYTLLDSYEIAHPGEDDVARVLLDKIRRWKQFALTGLGVFTFNRSFIFYSCGTILTYSLLLLQIERRGGHD